MFAEGFEKTAAKKKKEGGLHLDGKEIKVPGHSVSGTIVGAGAGHAFTRYLQARAKSHGGRGVLSTSKWPARIVGLYFADRLGRKMATND